MENLPNTIDSNPLRDRFDYYFNQTVGDNDFHELVSRQPEPDQYFEAYMDGFRKGALERMQKEVEKITLAREEQNEGLEGTGQKAKDTFYASVITGFKDRYLEELDAFIDEKRADYLNYIDQKRSA